MLTIGRSGWRRVWFPPALTTAHRTLPDRKSKRSPRKGREQSPRKSGKRVFYSCSRGSVLRPLSVWGLVLAALSIRWHSFRRSRRFGCFCTGFAGKLGFREMFRRRSSFLPMLQKAVKFFVESRPTCSAGSRVHFSPGRFEPDHHVSRKRGNRYAERLAFSNLYSPSWRKLYLATKYRPFQVCKSLVREDPVDKSMGITTKLTSSPDVIASRSASLTDLDDVVRKEQYVSTSLHLDTTTTLKWKIDNFALLAMRHSELRSPEFDGPKGTRWCLVLVLGDPRQKKAEERFAETQLFLVHCPEEAVGYKVRAQYNIYNCDSDFISAGPLVTEPTACVTKASDPNTIQLSWLYANNLTVLFSDVCTINGALRLGATISLEVSQETTRTERNLSFPIDLPHYIPGMLHLNDLLFITAQDRKVPAHKAYMREVSLALREAIGSMGSGQHFVVKQFHSSAVTAFVVYCYTGVLQESLIRGFGVEVLKLGHVFNVPGIVMEAADYCLRNINTEGEVRCFKIALEYGTHVQLRKSALVRIAKKYSELLSGPESLSVVLTPEQLTELQTQLRQLKSCSDPVV